MSRRLLTGACALVLLAQPMRASAQSGELEQAETAYLEIDFARTQGHALAALHGGGHSPEELVRIYQLLGIASSALGEEDAAREYFVAMLGLDPEATLDESVSPRLRGPYLEARGVWAARRTRLGIEAALDRGNSSIRFELRDPTDMAERVRVGVRLEGETDYQVQEYGAAPTLNASVLGAADADRVEYYVEVLDAHGNAILGEGRPLTPRVLGRPRVAAGPGEGPGGPSVFEEPLFWIIAGAVVFVGAAIATGVAVDQQSRVGVQTGVSIGIE